MGARNLPGWFVIQRNDCCGERCFEEVTLSVALDWMPCQRVHCRFSVEIGERESEWTSACLAWQAGEASDFSTVIGNEPAGKMRFNLLQRARIRMRSGFEGLKDLQKNVSPSI